MTNKYIAFVGNEKVLKGPVEMDKPDNKDFALQTDWDAQDWIKSNRLYKDHLASLPIAFTNVSWLGEEDNGKEMILGVHFEKKVEGDKIRCHCPCHRNKGMVHIAPCCQNGFIEMNKRTIAVPIKDKQPERIVKPPIGLLPRWRHIELRIDEIDDAIERYSKRNYGVPPEWLLEKSEHIIWLKQHLPTSRYAKTPQL